MTDQVFQIERPYGGGDPYDLETRARLERDAKEIIARYPKPRSALLPMLHLVQSEDGYITRRGIEFCADQIGITPAQVTGVATFYTQYKREPVGEFHVGVCINTLCAVMGGDEIWRELSEHAGVGHDETTPDGKVSLERIECNAACDFAPVVMVNWEFFDNMTPERAKRLVDDLRSGKEVLPSRGPQGLCSWKQASRVLAGFPDGRAHEGVQAGPESLRGLELARERGWEAPTVEQARASEDEPPHEPVKPGEVGDPPPNEPGEPIGGDVKPGSQEGLNK
ncbi:NADH-quinone oxidoreductase subunit NuoE [Actinomadura parmotrematis]|uniref:NADH-quinone oxidoreductase subunit NuoE n=1 Tax=Actinomadura parmotrematis TaxID=2864039 RepID=A0ABS7FXB7_9ACTN|nr:NADH-quinone oxidoreductase subunit NuoE [Actinomadura parmotrematis]MBW8485057.1 NADH-quinone oxidoreductase subunit NuoE [Actinomadura parmotrematis]